MQLLNPNMDYKKAYINFVKEVRNYGEIEFNPIFEISYLENHFEEFISYLGYISKHPKDEIIIPMKTYWAVEDGKVVGKSTLKINSHEKLFQYIGNVGYIVAPSERKKGVGSEILRLMKEKAKNLGYEEVILTCNRENTASQKIIEKNGGIFIDEIYWREKKMVNLRYRIKVI